MASLLTFTNKTTDPFQEMCDVTNLIAGFFFSFFSDVRHELANASVSLQSTQIHNFAACSCRLDGKVSDLRVTQRMRDADGERGVGRGWRD